MGQKRTASHPQAEVEKKKKTRESSQPSSLHFGDPEQRARCRRLVDQRFIEGCLIDWPKLELIGLID